VNTKLGCDLAAGMTCKHCVQGLDQHAGARDLVIASLTESMNFVSGESIDTDIACAFVRSNLSSSNR